MPTTIATEIIRDDKSESKIIPSPATDEPVTATDEIIGANVTRDDSTDSKSTHITDQATNTSENVSENASESTKGPSEGTKVTQQISDVTKSVTKDFSENATYYTEEPIRRPTNATDSPKNVTDATKSDTVLSNLTTDSPNNASVVSSEPFDQTTEPSKTESTKHTVEFTDFSKGSSNFTSELSPVTLPPTHTTTASTKGLPQLTTEFSRTTRNSSSVTEKDGTHPTNYTSKASKPAGPTNTKETLTLFPKTSVPSEGHTTPPEEMTTRRVPEVTSAKNEFTTSSTFVIGSTEQFINYCSQSKSHALTAVQVCDDAVLDAAGDLLFSCNKVLMLLQQISSCYILYFLTFFPPFRRRVAWHPCCWNVMIRCAIVKTLVALAV